MDKGPLVNEQINAGVRFLAEFQNYLPIQSAFWLKESENGRWYLYVASDQITDENFDVVYGEVGRLAEVIRDPNFDVFQVKVIGADDSLAKAVLEMQKRYPGRSPLRFHDKTFGGHNFEEVYVYPQPIPVPSP
jgi:hypothetical protein